MNRSIILFALSAIAVSGTAQAEVTLAPTPIPTPAVSVLKSNSAAETQPETPASEFLVENCGHCGSAGNCGCSGENCGCQICQELRRRWRVLRSKCGYTYEQTHRSTDLVPSTYYYYRPYNPHHVWQHLVESPVNSGLPQQPYSNVKFEAIYQRFAAENLPAPEPRNVNKPAELDINEDAVPALENNLEAVEVPPLPMPSTDNSANTHVLDILRNTGRNR